MNKIKILSDNLANQIAAGEVVERPASVVKELVENALDAGARRVSVDVELGGRRLMRVADDGSGMTRDDAVLAFERHATSKIKTLEDLGAIATLGFRGEALASIASVAKVELVTKTAEAEAATRVFVEGGRLRDVKDFARTDGTTISVRDLFFNTPARRKFMRSEATENYHLTNIVTHYALANPEIAFVLTSNGREIFRLTPAKDLRERAYQIFGAPLIESLLPVAGGREFVAKIVGFVSAPRERRTTRDGQYFFINGRFVRDKIIAGGLLEGFRSVLPHGVYPVAFLFLDVPHEEIDVNVHPAKTEVRFRRSEAVKEVISEAIRKSLTNAGIVSSETQASNSNFSVRQSSAENLLQRAGENIQPKIDFAESNAVAAQNFENKIENSLATDETKKTFAENSPTDFEIPVFSDEFENAAETRIQKTDFAEENKSQTNKEETEARTQSKIETQSQDVSQTQAQTNNSADKLTVHHSPFTVNSLLPPVNSGAKIPKPVEIETLSSGKIRPIGQLHESYIIAVDDEGMLLVDQHVAHERILFDKFRSKETERKIQSQNLLLPETFDLSPAQAAAFEEIEAELENLGFGLMRLSGRTIAVKSVPTDLPPSETRNLLAEILDAIERDKRGGAKATLRNRIAASLACKAAVKVNMKLTTEKMQWLIDKLLQTSSPTTCPHGRPVVLRLTMKDIERGFHRT